MAGSSPGSEVLTTLNHLPVTRSWNFRSTWGNGDWHSIDSGMSPNNAKGPICRVLPNIPNLFPRSNSKTMREAFHAPVVGGGYDDIQDGGRKLIPTTHHWSMKSSLITTDTSWKSGILKDLHSMGLRGNLPIFIGNFLSDRTSQIHLGSILSDKIFHREGVPQGAILSTTLFNIKINDIVKQVDPGVECSLYVDDFVIMYRSPTVDAIQRKLQHTINRLEKWTLENGFTISKNKTVAIPFFPDNKCMDPDLKLDNDPIQFVNEAKFLGLIWETKLTSESHIKYLKARCQKSLNILKVLSRTEWGVDQTTLLKLYCSLVRSKLDYGCIVYGSASKTALAKLDPVHNQGLRLCLGAFRSSPVESLYVEAHEPPLEIRRE